MLQYQGLLASSLVLTYLLIACEKKEDDKKSEGNYGTLIQTGTLAVTPQFASDNPGLKLDEPWSGDSYVINKFLHEYLHDRDNGKIDMSSMFKALYETARMGDTFSGTYCEEHPITAQTIASPFAKQDTSAFSYSCTDNDTTMQEGYQTGWAFGGTGTRKDMLIGYLWGANTGGGAMGSIVASVDDDADSVTMDMVTCVNCGQSDSSFSLRTIVSGTPSTSAFTIRGFSWGASNWVSFVGKGIAAGDGQHFLFRTQNKDSSDERFYCFPSSPTESEAKETLATSVEAIESPCSAYQSEVLALELLQPADVPQAEADFADESVLLQP